MYVYMHSNLLPKLSFTREGLIISTSGTAATTFKAASSHLTTEASYACMNVSMYVRFFKVCNYVCMYSMYV